MRIWSHLLKKSLTENFIFCELKYLQAVAACWLRPQVQKIYLPGDFILEYVMLMIKKCFSLYVVLGSEYASDF